MAKPEIKDESNLAKVGEELRRAPNVDKEVALSILRRGGELVEVLERLSIKDRGDLAYSLRERAIEADNHEDVARYSREYTFWWYELIRIEVNDGLSESTENQPFDIQQRNEVLESIGINVADTVEAGRLTGWELDKYSIEELLAAVQDRANETNYEQRERTTIAFNKASIAGFHRLIFIEDRKPTRGNVNRWLKTHLGQFEDAAPPEKQKIAHAITHFRDKFKAKLFYLEVDTKGNVIGKIPCTLTTNWQSDRKYGRYFVVNLSPEDEDTPPSVKGPKALPFLKLEP